MNKEECKKLLPAITHFVNGGELWYYSNTDRKWYKQDNFITQAEGSKIHNIIEDKHFEARKAYALGGEIEFRLTCMSSWLYSSKEPSWNEYEYRPKEPVYEWQWIYRYMAGSKWIYAFSGHYPNEDMVSAFIERANVKYSTIHELVEKFIPSRKIRK